jgi:hypothetical protein
LLWSVATAAGVGIGWYLAQTKGTVLYFGLPIGIFQGLVLLRKGRRTLLWALATGVGWIVACFVMFAFGLRINPLLIERGWTTAGDTVIGPAILLLTMLGVPIVACAQCVVLMRWTSRDDAIRWFGVSVFGFLMVSFAGRVLTDYVSLGDWVRGLVEIQPFEPTLWLIGAMWGACTGWAMAKMPEVVVLPTRG